MMRKSKSLKQSLRLSVSGVAVACVLFTGLVVGLFNWQKLWDLQMQKQLFFTQYTTVNIDTWFEEHLRKILFISQVNGLLEAAPQYQMNLLTSLVESNAAIEDVAIVGRDLQIVAGQDQKFSGSSSFPFEQKSVREVLETGIESVDLSATTQSPDNTYIAIMYPLKGPNNEVSGVLRAKLNLDYLRFNLSKLNYGDSGYSYLITPQNEIVVSNVNPVDFPSGDLRTARDYIQLMRNPPQLTIYKGLNGKKVVGTYERVNTLNWMLIVELPLHELWSDMYTTIILVILTIGVALMLAFILSRSVYLKLNKSLDSLSVAAKDVAAGNLGVKIENIQQNELGDVAIAFNLMTAQLRRLFDDTDYRLRFEQSIASIANLIIREEQSPQNRIMEQIHDIAATFLKAVRSHIFIFNEEEGVFNCKYEWYRDSSVKRLMHDYLRIPEDRFPLMMDLLAQYRVFGVGIDDGDKTTDQLYPGLNMNSVHVKESIKDNKIYKYIQNSDLKYFLCLPLLEQDKFFGIITFGFDFNAGHYVSEQKSMLGTLNGVVTSAMLNLRERDKFNREHEKLRTMINSIGDAVIATGPTGLVTLMNPVAEKLTGWDAQTAYGKDLDQVFRIISSDTRDFCESPLKRVLETNQTVDLAPGCILINKNEVEYNISDSASPIRNHKGQIIGVVLVFRDDSDKIQIEQEKAKLQRLEAVSLLAAGIAHDFNNLLTAIMGNISLAKDLVPHYSEAAKILTAAESSAEKGKDITNQLLVYAKGGVVEKKSSSIVNLLRDDVAFLMQGSKIKHKIDIAVGLKKIQMAEGVFTEIISNVILNAKQSMNGEGLISITASNTVIDQNSNLPLESGEYALISISDTGEGIPGSVIGKVFDPYYTTKNTGSGLGLTSVLSLLKKHNGHITINSKYQEGTMVNLYFPISEQDDEIVIKADETADTSYRILCYENDQTLQNLIKKALAPLNMDVVITASLVDMMEWFKISQVGGNSFSALMMDLSVHNNEYINTIVTELRTISSTVKIVLAGDMITKSSSADFSKQGIDAVVSKPFHISELRSTFKSMSNS
ncbi:MAG: hypothetical protein CVU48_03580 [Candidatus Cloacimonetes bacterium HGW-Cloacimonetes-1]|nr:MAG: hypothetical protein CVU48_03580 [Candidatus Cloacimonetes bacterium HGW-Cloacimonetes-1]